MEAWIPITIVAAAVQTLRFAAQKQLRTAGLGAGGATLARFVYSAPLAALLVWFYGRTQGFAAPVPEPGFWGHALAGGAAQILATMCVVALFSERHFAVGVTFKKTEVMLTAVAGFLVLGDAVSASGAGALALGFLGVLWLSDPPGGAGGPGRVFNRAAGLGVLSGVFFAISAVGYRGAVLSLSGGDTAFRAGVTLAMVTAAQSLALGGWLIWRHPAQVAAVFRNWRVAGLVGVLSMVGSFCWFAAFSLQNAAYVFALGQVELIFGLMLGAFLFREQVTGREMLGMAVITLSILLLVAVV